MLRVAFEFLMFAGSTGVFFSEDFRKNTLAVLVAGLIALASTVSLFMSINDLFKTNESSALAPSSMPPVTPADEIFWHSVKDSAVAGLFEEFERKFPSSKYVPEARARLAKLRKDQGTTAPPLRETQPSKTQQKVCVTFNNRQVCE